MASTSTQPTSAPMQGETRWGSPTATKTALLLHGLSSCSASYMRIAAGLVDAGYYVIAPDLIGHGFAARPSEYSLASFVDHLLPALDAVPPLDVLVGHSLGGIIAAALPLQFKQKPGFRMILLDPVLEFPAEAFEPLRAEIMKEVTEPLSVEQYQRENPRWKVEDCALKALGATLCTPEAAAAICDTNFPGTYTHHLPLPTHAISSPFEIIILGADPSLGAAFSLDEAKELAISRPYVKTAFVKGATHSVHREEPQLIVRVIVSGEARGEGLMAPGDVTVEGGALQPEQM